MTRWLATFCVAILATGSLAAQNLLLNPSFDSDVTDWSAPYIDRMDWIASDGNPAGSGPGCMEIAYTNNSGGSNGAMQYFDVVGGTTYQLSGWAKVPAGSVAWGADMWVDYYDASDVYLESSDTLFMMTQDGPWEQVSEFTTAPAAAVRARLRPSVLTASSGTDESIARWDDLFFGTSSAIFVDDFESGGTSRWTAAVP